MTKTVKYIGTQTRWSELAATGKQAVWFPGQQEPRSDTEAAALIATGQFQNLSDDVIEAAAAERLNALVSGDGIPALQALAQASKRRVRIAVGIDSLTDGAGGSTYRTDFAARMQAQYGNPLLGMSGFDDGMDGLLTQNGMTAIQSLAWNDPRRVKSFFGRGRYVSNTTTGSCDFSITTDPAVLPSAISIWVEFTAAAQKIYVKQFGASSTTLQLYTSDNFPLNTPVRITYPLTVATGGGVKAGLAISNVDTVGANDIYFWAKEFHWADRAGVEVLNLGIGGASVANWAGLTAANFQRWVQIIAADCWVINAGMNDRSSGLNNANPFQDKVPNATTFGQNLRTVIDRITGARPSDGVLVVPNEPSDVGTTGIGYYPDQIKAVAQGYGWRVADDRAILGTYSQAAAAALMYDGVHPNAAGNALRSLAYAAVFGA